MPLSSEARSIAYRWDDLPESVKARILRQIAQAEQRMRERLMRKSSEQLAKLIYPEFRMREVARD